MAMLRTAAITALFAFLPRVALACPVCFGESDAPMARAMNMGIGLMLLFVVGMMAAFASFFVSLARRSRLAETTDVSRAGSEPQEGIAQC